MEIPPTSGRALKRDFWRAIVARGCVRYDGVSVRDGTSTVAR